MNESFNESIICYLASNVIAGTKSILLMFYVNERIITNFHHSWPINHSDAALTQGGCVVMALCTSTKLLDVDPG